MSTLTPWRRAHRCQGTGSGLTSEQGSGSMVAMLIGVVILALLAAALTAGQTWRAASQARTAADLAALAGSGAAAPTQLVPLPPCLEAGRVAAANGARMVSCSVRQFDVTVTVSVDSGTSFGRATARSTAGPRPQEPPGQRSRKATRSRTPAPRTVTPPPVVPPTVAR